MKQLDGAELAGYIKEEQAREVRSLRQSHDVTPRLAIVQDNATTLNMTYAKLKQTYADDIGIQCDVISVETTGLKAAIQKLNDEADTHGIIVQLPIKQPELTDDIVAHIKPEKDVDGLGPKAHFDSATATAILWLLAGYNISLQGKVAAVVGQGRLVGKPLSDMLERSGIRTGRYDEHTSDLRERLLEADVVISAAGQPGLIKSEWIKSGAVVVDAGTTTAGGRIIGDASPELFEREDISITPPKGGVGPLTIAALFGHVLQAARGRVSA